MFLAKKIPGKTISGTEKPGKQIRSCATRVKKAISKKGRVDLRSQLFNSYNADPVNLDSVPWKVYSDYLLTDLWL